MNKVSIIVPIYNSEKHLTTCIESIVHQTFKNIEILLINDGSTDSSLSIIEDYSKKDSRIKVVNKLNEGVSKTKNLGLKLASSEFVLFVDSDDYIELNAVEKLMKYQRKGNLDLIKFHYNNYIDNKLHNTELKYPHFKVLKTQKEISEFKVKLLSGEIPGYMQLLLIKKECLGGLYINENINFLEDLSFYLDLLSKKIKIGVLNERLYNYVNNKNGLTFSLLNEKIFARLDGILFYFNHAMSLSDNNLQERVIYNSCTYLIVHSLFELYRSSFKNKRIIREYLRKDNIVDIVSKSNYEEQDRFTKKILKNYNNEFLIFFYFFVAKVYMYLKERR